MDERFPVKIEPMQRVEHSFENMYYCKGCCTYTTLPEDGCNKCEGGELISFQSMVGKMFKRKNKIEILFLLNIFLVLIILGGFLFSMNVKELLVSFAVLIICLIGIVVIQKRFKESLRTFELYKIIETEERIIKNSLEEDCELINKNMVEGEYLGAYKQLRNLGMIIKKEYIKKAKLRCLNRFVMRSDMPLEMDDLLFESYDKDLVVYIYEVSKVQRNIIKQATIEYMIKQEERIIEDFGNANVILGNIAGAAIYSKSKLELNKDFIMRYMANIPKDRLLRMKRLIDSNSDYAWIGLEEALEASLKGVSYAEI